jgi:predicted glycoside hydrolase/deacetylase ChbG (UPF0249 family)
MQIKKLIVNADDFGQSPGINKGIIKAYESGILTSASLMVRYSHAVAAWEYAEGTDLGVGLHVDLGEWKYNGHSWEAVYEVVSTDNANAVKREVNRQLEMFFKIAGKKPTHLDSHQHVHKNKLLLPLFIEIARELDVTLRSYSGYVKYCGHFYGQSSDGFPVHDAIGIKNLRSILTSLEDGITEVACHPAADIDIETMYGEERKIEVESLCDESIKESISESGIELCSFAGIPFNEPMNENK